MTARRALNQCDNSVTSDQNWPKQMLFHNVAAIMTYLPMWDKLGLNWFEKLSEVFWAT